MLNILLIETTSNICSVALSCDGSIVANYEYSDGMKHAEKLPVFVNSCIEKARDLDVKIDAVAISGGPGSYTGLRIGVSHAKGLCYGLKVPMIAIDTLEIIARNAAKENEGKYDYICPMVDARRMEVYFCLFDSKWGLEQEHSAMVIDELTYENILKTKKILFCGNGAMKCKDVIKSSNALFAENNPYVLAKDILSVAETKFENKDFVDLAYYEPYYLKEFYMVSSNK